MSSCRLYVRSTAANLALPLLPLPSPTSQPAIAVIRHHPAAAGRRRLWPEAVSWLVGRSAGRPAPLYGSQRSCWQREDGASKQAKSIESVGRPADSMMRSSKRSSRESSRSREREAGDVNGETDRPTDLGSCLAVNQGRSSLGKRPLDELADPPPPSPPLGIIDIHNHRRSIDIWLLCPYHIHVVHGSFAKYAR